MFKTQFIKAFYLRDSSLLITVPFSISPTNKLSASTQKEKNGLVTRDISIRNIPLGHEFYLFKKYKNYNSIRPRKNFG
jgi:hypothetical protein